jgi:CDP-diacylglycerol--serine O-phosphatidyltransferase
MKRVLSYLPNSITLLNLFFGCLAIVFALKLGWTVFAGYCIMVAAVFDFCDGLAARLLNAYSEIGKQLDSLADVVSFGVAPATLLYTAMCRALEQQIALDLDSLPWELLSFFPFILALFSALRLAKFNVDTRQSEQFFGLPTPANALLIVSFLMYAVYHTALDAYITPLSISIAVVVLSALLVVEIPMLALKFKGFAWRPNLSRYCFLILCVIVFIAVLLLGQEWVLSITLIILLYMLYSIAFAIANKLCKVSKS